MKNGNWGFTTSRFQANIWPLIYNYALDPSFDHDKLLWRGKEIRELNLKSAWETLRDPGEPVSWAN